MTFTSVIVMTSAHTHDEVLTSQEVADIFRVDAGTVRRWAVNGLIRSFSTPGGHLRFYRSDVSALIPPVEPESTTDQPTAAGAA